MLKLPNGQTYLQKADSVNSASIRKDATKYARISHAVNQGLAQRSRYSYKKNKVNKLPMAIHLLRKRCGKRRPPSDRRLAKVRGKVKGQPMQKRLPANSRASTTKPR